MKKSQYWHLTTKLRLHLIKIDDPGIQQNFTILSFFKYDFPWTMDLISISLWFDGYFISTCPSPQHEHLKIASGEVITYR